MSISNKLPVVGVLLHWCRIAELLSKVLSEAGDQSPSSVFCRSLLEKTSMQFPYAPTASRVGISR